MNIGIANAARVVVPKSKPPEQNKADVAKHRQAKAERAEREIRNMRDTVRWRLMRHVISELVLHPALGSPAGKMYLIGFPVSLSAVEFEASVRLGDVMAEYDRVVLGVKRSVRAQDPNRIGGEDLSDGPSEKQVKRASGNMMDAERIMGFAGPSCATACKALVRGEDWERRVGMAIAGLRTLAVEWGLRDVPEAKVKRMVESMLKTA